MIKIKILKDSRNRKPIDRTPIEHTPTTIDGFGAHSDYTKTAGHDYEPASLPRYAMEECDCGCESCMSGDHHPSKGDPDLNGDGTYSPEELYYHFDLDDDGIVTPNEYEDHVEWHADNPEVLDYDDDMLYEKKDRCYHLAKQKYDVFPSAYASGFIVRCRKGKVGRKKKVNEGTFDKEKKQGLHGWFARQGGKGKSKGWVDCRTCRTDPDTGRKTCKTCGRQKGEKRSGYPACRPTPSACTKTGTSKKKSSTRVSWKKKKEE